jgi:putative transcriptional regulator
MPKLTEAELLARHAKRDIWGEALQGVRDLKAGKYGRRYGVESCPVATAREKVGLTQAEFASLLGVSVRTLREWEQGRRQPTGAARTLIRVAESHPEVLRELAA